MKASLHVLKAPGFHILSKWLRMSGGGAMNQLDSIQQELAKATTKKRELAEKLRQLEETEPANFHQIWIIRDQIAYWEGKSEGLQFALDQLAG